MGEKVSNSIKWDPSNYSKPCNKCREKDIILGELQKNVSLALLKSPPTKERIKPDVLLLVLLKADQSKQRWYSDFGA